MSEFEQAVRSGVRKALREEKSQQTVSESEIRGAIRETIQELLTEDDDYQNFVDSVMEVLNIDSPQDLTEEGRKEFFNYIDRNYNEDSDQADDINHDDLSDAISPSHYENESKCPDFIKQTNEVKEAAQRVVRKMISDMS